MLGICNFKDMLYNHNFSTPKMTFKILWSLFIMFICGFWCFSLYCVFFSRYDAHLFYIYPYSHGIPPRCHFLRGYMCKSSNKLC